MTIKKCLSSPKIISYIARELVGNHSDLSSFTSLNRTIYRYGIVLLWEEVHDVTQLAYLFPTLVVHCTGEYYRDPNDIVVCTCLVYWNKSCLCLYEHHSIQPEKVLAFDRPPNPLEWGRFHEHARHIKSIVFALVQHQPFLVQMTTHLPAGPLFPNLKTFYWASTTEEIHPPPSLFLSPSITHIKLQITENTNLPILFRNLAQANCSPKSLQAHAFTHLSNHVSQLLMHSLQCLTWIHLTSIDISKFAIRLPSDTNIILSLSLLRSLTICHLSLESEEDTETVEELALDLSYGFLSLRELGIGWDSSQSSYHFVQCLIRSMLSRDLTKITLHLPLSPHPTFLPSEWIKDLFDSLSIHSIHHLLIDYCHVHPGPQASKPFYCGFLQPYLVEILFQLSHIQSVSFFGIVTDWNHSLAFKMAKSWSEAHTISFTTYNNTDPLFGMRTEAGHYMDIRDLIHFAKYSPRLERISLPLNSLFQFADDVAARYKLNTKRGEPIFVDDHNTYAINNLAMAAFLYELFGRGIYTHLRLGHSLYRALRVYGECFGGQEGKDLDYKSWMLKGFTDPFYDDHLPYPLEGDWYEKGYSLLENVSDDGIDDDSIEVDGQSDSEGDEMQTDSEEDLGSQYSVEI